MPLSVHQQGVGICLPESLTRPAIFGGGAPFGALRTPKNCGVSRPEAPLEQIVTTAAPGTSLKREQHSPTMLV